MFLDHFDVLELDELIEKLFKFFEADFGREIFDDCHFEDFVVFAFLADDEFSYLASCTDDDG